METKHKYFVNIYGYPYKLNDDKTHIYFQGEWRKLIIDNNLIYFNCNGANHVLDDKKL